MHAEPAYTKLNEVSTYLQQNHHSILEQISDPSHSQKDELEKVLGYYLKYAQLLLKNKIIIPEKVYWYEPDDSQYLTQERFTQLVSCFEESSEISQEGKRILKRMFDTLFFKPHEPSPSVFQMLKSCCKS